MYLVLKETLLRKITFKANYILQKSPRCELHLKWYIMQVLRQIRSLNLQIIDMLLVCSPVSLKVMKPRENNRFLWRWFGPNDQCFCKLLTFTAIGGSKGRGVPGTCAPLHPIFFSFSCSFREKIGQVIDQHLHLCRWRSRLGNPGSTTENQSEKDSFQAWRHENATFSLLILKFCTLNLLQEGTHSNK